MRRVRLIHWKAAEAGPRVEALRAAGYAVEYQEQIKPTIRAELARNPPDAIVIDLTRLPSHGRDVALAFRQFKVTRHVPLVVVEGEPEKVAGLKKLLPDAVYTSWSRIRSALRDAIAHPPAKPVVAASVLAGYSGTPLPKKLGIKPNSVVALLGAPEGFRQTLGELPKGVKFQATTGPCCNLTLWFLRSRRELENGMARMEASAGHAPLWMIWPKKASGMPTDLTQQDVREIGLAAGWVDYKVCAVDATWSGLLFRLRRLSAATAPRGTSSTPRKQTARK